MIQLLGMCVIAFTFSLMLLNGLLMLLAPTVWFDLPGYITFRGSLRRSSFTSRYAFLPIRLLGLIVIIGFILMTTSITQHLEKANLYRLAEGNTIYRLICIGTCLSVSGCGLIFLLKPQSW